MSILRDIQQSVETGISNAIEDIGDKLADGLMEGLSNIGIFLLDGASVLVKIFIIYTAFKMMIIINKEKQAENMNQSVCLMGIYFIVRVLGVILKNS